LLRGMGIRSHSYEELANYYLPEVPKGSGIMTWKVTRNGEDIYPGNTGIPKMNALRQADMLNRWAEMNGSEPTYGIRPLKKATAEEELAHVDDIDVLTDGNAIRTPYGLCSPGFSRDNPPW